MTTTTIEKPSPVLAPPEPAVVARGQGDGQGAPSLEVLRAERVDRAPGSGAPALTPPVEIAEAAGGEEGIGAWHNSVKITALWCNASARNAWAAVDGLGWRRVNPANDSAFLTLTALLSHARQMNVACNLRIENDNLIHEAYVW
jgi:hypothetical protein